MRPQHEIIAQAFGILGGVKIPGKRVGLGIKAIQSAHRGNPQNACRSWKICLTSLLLRLVQDPWGRWRTG